MGLESPLKQKGEGFPLAPVQTPVALLLQQTKGFVMWGDITDENWDTAPMEINFFLLALVKVSSQR